MDKKIYTSLYVYSNYLFSAYIDGVIDIQKLPKIEFKFFLKSKIKPLVIDSGSWIIDMQAYKNVLFASTTKQIFAYNLDPKALVEKRYQSVKFIRNCTHLKIDYKNKLLFAISENLGIIALDIRDPVNIKRLSNIVPYFIRDENMYYPVTDFDVYDGMIFIALRSYGIVRIDFKLEFNYPHIYREFLKIPLNDPQGVKYSPYNKLLYVIDAKRGLIITDLGINKIIFDKKLGRSDFPQEIIIHYSDAIIKCKNSIYYYKSSENKALKIYKYKVGAITKYYNRLIFSRKGRLNVIKIGKFKSNEKTNLKNSKLKFVTIKSFDG